MARNWLYCLHISLTYLDAETVVSRGKMWGKSRKAERYPNTLATPLRRTTQALASCCWWIGQTSTRSARMPTWTVCMAQKRQNVSVFTITVVARRWVSVYLFPLECRGPVPNNRLTRDFVHAKPNREVISTIPPNAINGLRFPHDSRHRSLHRPNSGCIKMPETGPARNVIAVCDLSRPRERRCMCVSRNKSKLRCYLRTEGHIYSNRNVSGRLAKTNQAIGV
jgi:hypothetical protein